MRINVLDSKTGNDLFAYRSAVVPRQGETIDQNDTHKLIVEQVIHRVGYEQEEPYVDLLCRIE